MVEFAGFLMPVSYGSIIEEHRAVRERVGHLRREPHGRVRRDGTRAREFVNEVITNDCSKLAPGAVQYSVMCRENGTTVDDLLVFAVDDDRDASSSSTRRTSTRTSRTSSVFPKTAWQSKTRATRTRSSRSRGRRRAKSSRRARCSGASAARSTRSPTTRGSGSAHEGTRSWSRGPVTPASSASRSSFRRSSEPRFWEAIVEAGRPFGIEPIGLGARDTLRFEASYCLYGHELDDETSPLEAGLGWVVKLAKESFRGAGALRKEKETGSRRTLVGLELEGRNIARPGYGVMSNGAEVGKVTSGDVLADAREESVHGAHRHGREERGRPVFRSPSGTNRSRRK